MAKQASFVVAWSRELLWSAYAAFVATVVVLAWHDRVLDFSGPFAAAKAAVWLGWLVFLGFSVRVSYRENFFRSSASLWRLLWGRQVGIDLYIGVALSFVIIAAHGGAVTALVWLVPLLVFANLATLVYFGLHFDALVAAFGV